MAEFSMGTLYTVNKQLMSDKEHFKPLTHPEIAGAQKKIENFFNMIAYYFDKIKVKLIKRS